MTTDYIIHRVDIVSSKFRGFTFGGADRYNKISKKCVDMEKSCHTHFSGTCKIFFMKCYELKFLFISYIHLEVQSSSFCVQVKVILMLNKIITCISTDIEIMLMIFWILPKKLGMN